MITAIPPIALPAQAASAASAILGSGQSIGGASAAATPVPFGDLVTDAIGSVNRMEAQARTAVEGLMSGTGVDIHQAMIASDKAQTGFELVLAVRNKALSAYQQVMGMQF